VIFNNLWTRSKSWRVFWEVRIRCRYNWLSEPEMLARGGRRWLCVVVSVWSHKSPGRNYSTWKENQHLHEKELQAFGTLQVQYATKLKTENDTAYNWAWPCLFSQLHSYFLNCISIVLQNVRTAELFSKKAGLARSCTLVSLLPAIKLQRTGSNEAGSSGRLSQTSRHCRQQQ
jgi:hypothetical protein